MNTIEIEYAISKRFDTRTHLVVPNVSWGALNHEADVLVVRETGYCIEFEIKQSFPDYKNDFKKHKWKLGPSKLIKEFYYVFPAELWHKREGDIKQLLPDFAGVLVVYREFNIGSYAKEMKAPKPNNIAKKMNDRQMYNVARLGTMRIWNLKRTIIQLTINPQNHDKTK